MIQKQGKKTVEIMYYRKQSRKDIAMLEFLMKPRIDFAFKVRREVVVWIAE